MDDRRFDAVTRALGQRKSRRVLLKTLLGIGGVATAGAVLHDTDAARRGYSGPPTPGIPPTQPPAPPTQPPPPPPTGTTAPICPGRQTPCGADCCCPAGETKCGSACCADGQTVCCDGACCAGTCFGEELCCPPGFRGCDDGVCYPGGCCTDADCPLLCEVCGTDHICRACEDVGQMCQNGTCVAPTPPTSTPTHTPEPTSTPTSSNTPSPTITPTPTPCGESGTASCTANDQCCSGICQAGLCVATIAGICPSGFDFCSGTISNVPCGGNCLCGTLSNGSIICFVSGACFDDCDECGDATCDPGIGCCPNGGPACFEPCTPNGIPG